jgi:transposase-like protein
LYRCPYCRDNEHCIKCGLNRNGTQRCRCQRCRRYFTPISDKKWNTFQMKAQAVRLYLEGRSLRAIARQMRVHHQTVGRWIACSFGIEELREKAIKLFLEEKSVYFAFLFLPAEVSYRTVSMWIRSALPLSLKERAFSLHLKKTSMFRIMSEIGVRDERTVRKWVEQAKSGTTEDV